MSMVDMKRTPKEKKAQEKKYDKPMSSHADYGYGLNVDLDHEHMTKLGMATPKVGDKIPMKVHGHVTSVSENHHDGDDEPTRRVSIQLRHIGIENEKRTEGMVSDPVAEGAKNAMDSALAAGSESKGNGFNKGKKIVKPAVKKPVKK